MRGRMRLRVLAAALFVFFSAAAGALVVAADLWRRNERRWRIVSRWIVGVWIVFDAAIFDGGALVHSPPRGLLRHVGDGRVEALEFLEGRAPAERCAVFNLVPSDGAWVHQPFLE